MLYYKLWKIGNVVVLQALEIRFFSYTLNCDMLCSFIKCLVLQLLIMISQMYSLLMILYSCSEFSD